MEQSTDLTQYKDLIQKLPIEEQRELLDLMENLSEAKTRELSRLDFLEFVRHVWPAFIAGAHHKTMADAFERVAKGELKRLIINMPPRHTKSEFASYLSPLGFLGATLTRR